MLRAACMLVALAGAQGRKLAQTDVYPYSDMVTSVQENATEAEALDHDAWVLDHDHKLPDVEWYRQRTMEQDPWYKANEDWWAAKDNGTTISVPPPLPRNETEYAYLKEEEEEKVLESNDDPWYLSTTSTQTDYPYGGSD